MILKDHFFTIKYENISGEKAVFRVKLNTDHFIYQAHFPNNPITPGVCLIQIVMELFGYIKSKSFRMKTLKNVKFTAPINPFEYNEIDILLEFMEQENHWHIKTIIQEKETVFAKISMIMA